MTVPYSHSIPGVKVKSTTNRVNDRPGQMVFYLDGKPWSLVRCFMIASRWICKDNGTSIGEKAVIWIIGDRIG